MRIFIVIFWFSCICCGNRSQSSSFQKASDIKSKSGNNSCIQFDFQHPSQTYILDQKLKEISGLTYDFKTNTFLAIEDETGNVYILSSDDFSLESEIKFGTNGDYESIEKVGEEVWVGTSDGSLYSYNLLTKSTTKIKTGLRFVNNVEGSCYLEEYNSLLLACKGEALNNSDRTNKSKFIYAYDLDKKMLIQDPYITITDDQIENFISSNYKNVAKKRQAKLSQKATKFSPSGIAIHPISKELYIISAKGSTLVICDKKGYFKAIEFLPSKTIPQPEGIAFDYKGNLFISTEGQGFSGKMFRYNYNP